VSYGIRLLQNGRLECFYGDDRWLAIAHPHRNSIAMAYSFATEACGFRRGRHEGKLTGLAAHGSPTLAGAISRHYHLDDAGLVAADFTSWRAMKKTIDQICHGHSREEIAASIQAVVEDLIVRSVGHWLERTRARNLALRGGLFSNVRLNRLLAESLPLDEIFIFPAMGDVEISSRNRYTARFMTICCGVRPQWRERLTATTHLDNTARPQILSDEDNPLFAAILRCFHERTAIPVLINTSFNIHEEPIINRPEECAKALLDGRVDFVVTANALYSMADAEEIIRAKSRRIKARGPDLTPRPVTSNATAI